MARLRLRHDGRRRGADLVLFLAADLQDLSRRAARPASLRGGAREPDGDAHPARASWRSARSPPAGRSWHLFAGHGADEFFREFAEVRARQYRARGHGAACRSSISLAPTVMMIGGFPGGLAVLYPPARSAGGAGARQQAVLYHFLLNKWYFDEHLRLPLRPAGDVARPLVLEGRRRLHHRRLRA